jgi:UDP-N-acetylglucosamine--N-acetylmuramyl-(pentapeptide) pyrophosphoryl-undecaprenol N-acetylglucosamine transferase
MRARAAHQSSDRPVVFLATSSGGHIDLLYAVRRAFAGYRRVWVVQPSQRGELLAADGEVVHTLPKYDRHPIRGHFLGNIIKAARIVLRERPRLVVTSGAGITVPFCLFTRLTGGKVIFVETMARVTGPSVSGKALSRLASRVLVQWPEALGAYRRARLCHPALLEAVTGDAPARGYGTFVAVGTHSQQFDRLLEMVDRAVARGVLPTPVVAQGGVSRYRPRHYELRDWLTPDEVERAVQNAEHVVSHAGSGLVSCALRAGRRPMVLPRLSGCGEHFDDHQTQIVAKLAELDLVVKLEDDIDEESLEAARRPLPVPEENDGTPSVEEALRAELISELGNPPLPVPLGTPAPVTTAS